MKVYEQMKNGRAFFMKMMNADCDRIAVENPLPMKICELPQPTQIIQPYEYGHPYSKRTLLWLKGLPPLIPTNILTDHTPWLPSNTSAFAKGRGGSKGAIMGTKNYSKTFPGIARAMAEQWGGLTMTIEQYEQNCANCPNERICHETAEICDRVYDYAEVDDDNK